MSEYTIKNGQLVTKQEAAKMEPVANAKRAEALRVAGSQLGADGVEQARARLAEGGAK